MRRVQVILFVLLGLAAAGIALLALRTRQPPLLPADRDHAAFLSAGRCLTCHGPGGVLPRSKNHPLGDDCLRCHGSR